MTVVPVPLEVPHGESVPVAVRLEALDLETNPLGGRSGHGLQPVPHRLHGHPG